MPPTRRDGLARQGQVRKIHPRASQKQPKNTTKRRNNLSTNNPKAFPKTIKNPPHSTQEHPQCAPRAPKSAQERSKSAPRGSQERPGSPQELPESAQGCPKGVQKTPKPDENGRPNPQKVDVKNNVFLTSIFSLSGGRFRRFAGRCFAGKAGENCQRAFVTKTLKILLPSRRNANF